MKKSDPLAAGHLPRWLGHVRVPLGTTERRPGRHNPAARPGALGTLSHKLKPHSGWQPQTAAGLALDLVKTSLVAQKAAYLAAPRCRHLEPAGVACRTEISADSISASPSAVQTALPTTARNFNESQAGTATLPATGKSVTVDVRSADAARMHPLGISG
jgi:hypothetical protein